MRTTLILLLAVTAVPAAELDKKAREIDRYVKQLGDPEFKVRAEADRQLRAIGEPALDAVAKAAKCDDAEVAKRAIEIVAAIEKTMKWEVRQFAGPADQVLCAAFDAAGKRCAAGGFDKVIRVWDVATGKELQKLEGHTDIVFSVAFSPDGKHLLSTSGGDRRDGQWSEGEDH